MTVLLERVKRVRDAQFADCATCGLLPGSQFWGPSQTRGLHTSGTGHRVTLVRVAGVVQEPVR